jgi:hypothetical protein
LRVILKEEYDFDSETIEYIIESAVKTPTNFHLGGNRESGMQVGSNDTAVSAHLHSDEDDDKDGAIDYDEPLEEEEKDEEEDSKDEERPDGGDDKEKVIKDLSKNALTAYEKDKLKKEDVYVKNKKSGSVYKVKDANPAKHEPPSKADIEKAKEDDKSDKSTDDKPKTSDSKATFDKDSQKKMDSMREKSAQLYDELPDDKQVLFNDSMKKIETIMSDNATPEQKKESAQWLVDNMGFSTNSNGQKAYLNKLGGDRKILGDGTAATKKLVDNVKELVDIKEYNASGVKNSLSTASKPDLGKENIALPSNDKGVKELFSDNSTLSRIRPGLHGIYGVKDENGKIKIPSSDHSKEYLTQSFGNPALDNTINKAQELVDSGQLDAKFVDGLKKHKEKLSKITENYDIPSQEAADAINESYNELFSELHNSDSDAAGAVIKQIAENNLYEQELAKGEEVYLPSAGNFPGGDKIRKNDTERIDLISCKFGKSGRTYGFPANAKAVTQLHPDESKRGRSGQYVGEDGNTLMIKDELIIGKDAKETKTKTTKFIKDNLEEIGLGEVFSDNEISQITNITTAHATEIAKIKKGLEGTKPASLYWDKFNKQLEASEKKLSKQLGELVSDEQLAQIVGPNNVSNLKRKDGIRPQNLLGAIEISNNIKTSGGYGLSHNKQYFDENDKPKYVTEKGNDNIDDYSITFRDKRTKGRAGGGVQMSFSGDSKKED